MGEKGMRGKHNGQCPIVPPPYHQDAQQLRAPNRPNIPCPSHLPLTPLPSSPLFPPLAERPE